MPDSTFPPAVPTVTRQPNPLMGVLPPGTAGMIVLLARMLSEPTTANDRMSRVVSDLQAILRERPDMAPVVSRMLESVTSGEPARRAGP